MKLFSTTVLDAAIALDKGNIIPAEEVRQAIIEEQLIPNVMVMIWRASGLREQNKNDIKDVFDYIKSPLSLEFLLAFHKQLLSMESFR